MRVIYREDMSDTEMDIHGAVSTLFTAVYFITKNYHINGTY